MDAVESSQDEDGNNCNDPYYEVIPTAKRKIVCIFLAQIREANPGINIVIPDVLLQSTPDNSSSAPIQIESVTIVANLPNQVQHVIGLEGSIPETIGKLTTLTALDLSGNQLFGIIPPSIGNLINIQTLHLMENKLTANIPPEIGRCRSLTNLFL
ncbi:probable LRR receptor-like serine/threonine-protein kinase At5g10290 [Chenopodium quinoa]|uniref:probable LRR receptor-like serine/threonine-protein kinase At5g10290 n=1 Tax=Chenopodium quinoa TaxID=63459 RepID=UPI000B798DAF|nr:probable LRR receptor-like serine/threonine-protein kinase At5g10290 [Chenopodium quinoa]